MVKPSKKIIELYKKLSNAKTEEEKIEIDKEIRIIALKEREEEIKKWGEDMFW